MAAGCLLLSPRAVSQDFPISFAPLSKFRAFAAHWIEAARCRFAGGVALPKTYFLDAAPGRIIFNSKREFFHAICPDHP
jgi:hypothetical protein